MGGSILGATDASREDHGETRIRSSRPCLERRARASPALATVAQRPSGPRAEDDDEEPGAEEDHEHGMSRPAPTLSALPSRTDDADPSGSVVVRDTFSACGC